MGNGFSIVTTFLLRSNYLTILRPLGVLTSICAVTFIKLRKFNYSTNIQILFPAERAFIVFKSEWVTVNGISHPLTKFQPEPRIR